MSHARLITTDMLAAQLDNPDWAVVDCRFRLDDPAAGRQAYRAAHIPGALYAHLDEDLSGPILPGATGRHPLPTVEAFAARLAHWGIDERVQVVAYDDMGGVFAARLWWMLNWMGHRAVAVLDGGWTHWIREVRPTRSGEETRGPRTFVAREQPAMQVDVDLVLDNLENDDFRLVDARDDARYRGESTGLDPIGGHIPGAVCAHHARNLDAEGKFLPPAALRAYYEDLLADPDAGVVPDDIVFYCGSGVSAAHNLLAMEVAGLGTHRLYAGSWSEWILDPSRPIATGA